MNLDLRTLEAFYWVARLGGFGRAAEKLHTTQPAISARIAAMEAAFGVRLLDRDRRSKLALTPKGVALLALAERMLALRGEIVASLTAPDQLGGTVRLGVAETLVHTWLSTLVRRLHAEHPRITLDISVDTTPRLSDALTSGEIDVALLLGPVSRSDAANLPLGDVPLAWAASPGLALAGTGLADLACWPLLTYPRTTRPYRQLAEMFAAFPGTRIFANSSMASIIRMAIDGIGIAVIPPAVIARELADGSLILIPAPLMPPPLRFTASHLDGAGNALAATVARMAAEVATAY